MNNWASTNINSSHANFLCSGIIQLLESFVRRDDFAWIIGNGLQEDIYNTKWYKQFVGNVDKGEMEGNSNMFHLSSNS